MSEDKNGSETRFAAPLVKPEIVLIPTVAMLLAIVIGTGHQRFFSQPINKPHLDVGASCFSKQNDETRIHLDLNMDGINTQPNGISLVIKNADGSIKTLVDYIPASQNFPTNWRQDLMLSSPEIPVEIALESGFVTNKTEGTTELASTSLSASCSN